MTQRPRTGNSSTTDGSVNRGVRGLSPTAAAGRTRAVGAGRWDPGGTGADPLLRAAVVHGLTTDGRVSVARRVVTACLTAT
jgi:hypothetical protein